MFGIHIYNGSTYSGVSNHLVEGNFIHDNQEGMVISYGDNNIVQNNIVYNNTSQGIQEYSETRLKLLHNTLWGNGQGFTSNDSDTVIQDNISDKGGGGQNTYTSDPQFVSVGTDFHLHPHSPAKTAGSDGGEVGAYGHGNTCVGPTW